MTSRLTRLPPLVARLASSTAAPAGQVPAAPKRDEPWRRWYKTARWRQLRWEVLTRDGFRCQMAGCGVMAPEMVCDHVRPHRGDERLFWDVTNLQALCKPCHDGRKQREEQASLRERGVWD